jgi:microcystin-dependent protein
MAQPCVGEIRMFAGNYAPEGWAFCDGSLLSIAEQELLFTLIGTTYGGDGQETFALPDLRGRVPIHQGTGNGLQSYTLGEKGGTETVTLTTAQMPAHTHTAVADSAAGSQATPGGGVWAANAAAKPYGSSAPSAAMNAAAVASSGGGQPHENMLPFLGINYIISLSGIYPSS